jgi:hypothetical protein
MLISSNLRLLAGMRYGDKLKAAVVLLQYIIRSMSYVHIVDPLPYTDRDQGRRKAPLSAGRSIEMPDPSIASKLSDPSVAYIYFGIHGKPSLCISTASWKM